MHDVSSGLVGTYFCLGYIGGAPYIPQEYIEHSEHGSNASTGAPHNSRNSLN
jgi:hypothetical protein